MIPSVVFMLLANGWDLIYSMVLITNGLAAEANPIAAFMLSRSIYWFIIYKLALGSGWALMVMRGMRGHPKILDGTMLIAGALLMVAPLGVLSWLY